MTVLVERRTCLLDAQTTVQKGDDVLSSGTSEYSETGTALRRLYGVLEKSCQDRIADSVKHQAARFKDAGFPREVIALLLNRTASDSSVARLSPSLLMLKPESRFVRCALATVQRIDAS